MTAATLFSTGSNNAGRSSVRNFPALDAVAGAPVSATTGYNVEFSQQGGLYAIANTDASGPRVYNVSDWSEITKAVNVADLRGLAFSPDGSRLAVVSRSVSPYLFVYDTSTWNHITVTAPPSVTGAFSVAWSLDGNRLVIGTQGGSIGYHVYDTSDFSLITGYANPSTGYERSIAVAISERADVIVVRYESSPYVTVIDLTTKLRLWELGGSPTFSNSAEPLAISPDGSILAMADRSSPYLHMCDPRTGNPVPGPSGGNLPSAGTSAVAFDFLGDYMMAGYYLGANKIVYWDTATWTRVEYTAGTIGGQVNAVAFNGAEDIPPVAVENPIILGIEF